MMMEKEVDQIEVVDLEDGINYLTPISCRGNTRNDAISVELYAENRDLHRAILASCLQATAEFIDLSNQDDEENDDDDNDLRVLETRPPTPLGMNRNERPFWGPSVRDVGQSSYSNPDSLTFICEICVEPKPQKDSFCIKGCGHFYCSDCMMRYVASKLQDNMTRISCPVSSCGGVLEPEYCRPILTPEVFDRWGNALCESVILGSQKFYCPYKDCSALLIDDGEEIIRQSECPNCWRLFCAQCKVPWHSGIDCAEFQNLNRDEREKEDLLMMNLARTKNWRRCPKCRFYVEKSSGCMYMKCRCGIAFCYNCGAPHDNDLSHYCSKCNH